MQCIRIVLESSSDRPDTDRVSEFRRKLRPHYKGVHLAVRIQVNPDDADDELLELSHDVASRAEEERRATRADFAAYLRPVTPRFAPEQSDEKNDLIVFLIAVAHKGGIGAFVIARPRSPTTTSVPAVLELLEGVAEVTGVMRPRTRHSAHAEAEHLGNVLTGIIEDMVEHS